MKSVPFLTVLKVTLNEATSSVESRKYFDDVTTALTDEIERMADKEPTAKLMHHFEGTYDMPLEDIGKGSIILSLRVKTKNSLERLKSDVKSGKFSKECSKILFPNADNLYGIKDELCLLETYAVGEFERVYQELERIGEFHHQICHSIIKFLNILFISEHFCRMSRNFTLLYQIPLNVHDSCHEESLLS